MPEQIPTEAIQTLMTLGLTNPGPERDRLLANVNAWEFVNRLHWNDWEPILEPLNAAGHEALGKGLVVAEETRHWCCGSVAAAIWVYRALERKFPEAADALADWMLAHSSNPWVPFGRDRGSARSIVECRSSLETWRERKERIEDIELGRTELKAAKEGVRKRVSMYREQVQHATSTVRAAFIRTIEGLSPAARLEHLAWDKSEPTVILSRGTG